MKILLSLVILSIALSQTCINNIGQPVEWWIILKTPPKINQNGYAYFDARSSQQKFAYIPQEVDKSNSCLTNTINSLNEMNVSILAWNDQKPSGQTSSTSAHSKGLISININNQKGLFLSHSIPKYPLIINNKINSQIFQSQQIYGQHIACFSLTISQLDRIAANLLITKLFIYHSSIPNTSKTYNLYKLGANLTNKIDLPFVTQEINSVLRYSLKTIYKNQFINSSIFEDGLTSYLKTSPIFAQTWGRPLQQAWCDQNYQVKNVLYVQINENIIWKQTQDHSKWLLAGNNYACFGDMNRMQSQWKRGGSFYCLSQPSLVKALRSIIVLYDECSQHNLSYQ